LKIAQAFFLQRLLQEIALPLFWERNKTYYWASALSGLIILSWVMREHSFLRAEVLGSNMKSAVLGLLFKKVCK